VYNYSSKLIAPRTVQFQTRTAQGHRIVTVYLDSPTPRFVAFNERSAVRTPATLWLDEIERLITCAKEICKIKGDT